MLRVGHRKVSDPFLCWGEIRIRIRIRIKIRDQERMRMGARKRCFDRECGFCIVIHRDGFPGTSLGQALR